MKSSDNLIDAIKDPLIKALYARLIASPFDERKRILFEAGTSAATEFEKKLIELEDHLLRYSPFQTLARFGYYDFAYLPETGEKMVSNDVIEMFHVEMIQALLLAHKSNEFDSYAPSAQEFQVIRDLVREVSTLFLMRDFSATAQNENEDLSYMLRSNLRAHTRMVRGWGNEIETLDVLRTLLAPIDDKIKSELGFSLKALISMFSGLDKLAKERRQDHFDRVKSFGTARSKIEAVEKFKQAFPNHQVFAHVTEVTHKQNWSLKELKMFLHVTSDSFLHGQFAFGFDDFLNSSKQQLTPENLRLILQSLSLKLGDLADSNREHLFLNNPIWRKPFIQVTDQTWWFPITVLFHAFCFEILESFLAKNSRLKVLYEERRAAFLEEKIECEFSEAFPNVEIFCGSCYTEPKTGKCLENDLLVVFDTIAIIVEAKAGAVNPGARRGGPSIAEEVKKLVVKTSVQCNAFKQFLETNRKTHLLSTKNGKENRIDSEKIRTFAPFGVTFEHIGCLSTQLDLLKKAGLATREVSLVPTMSLPDLQTLLHIFDNPFQLLHYLTRRAAFEKGHSLVADEMDLIVYYLQTGFVDAFEEQKGKFIQLYGASQKLTHYFAFRGTQHAVQKPERPMTIWWREILQSLDTRKTHGRYEIGCLLLDMPVAIQEELEESVLQLCNQLNEKSVPAPAARTISYRVQSDYSTTEIVAVVGKGIEEHRREIVENFAKDALMDKALTQVVAIVVDVELQSWPYRSIHVLDRLRSLNSPAREISTN